MRDCIRELCILSIFCGAALSLCPEGGARKVLQITESLVLLAVILNGFGKLDLSAYPLQLARAHEREALLSESEERLNRLDRLVIEEEYRAYAEKRAGGIGMEPVSIQIWARWSSDGLWVPDSARIETTSEQFRDELTRILWGELGIPSERQEWIIVDTVLR